MKNILGAFAITLTLVAQSRSSWAGGCSTPDVFSGDPMGGDCSLTCRFDAANLASTVLEGFNAYVFLLCPGGVGTGCEASLADPSVFFGCSASAEGPPVENGQESCTCSSGPSVVPDAFELRGGLVLSAGCSCAD